MVGGVEVKCGSVFFSTENIKKIRIKIKIHLRMFFFSVGNLSDRVIV